MGEVIPMSNKNKKGKDKPQEKKGELVSLTNGMIHGVQMNQSLKKLRQQSLDPNKRQEVYQLCAAIRDSVQAKALQNNLTEMEEGHKEANNGASLLIKDPKVQELFNLDSGLQLHNVRIRKDLLGIDFKADDMFLTDWIIEYVEK